MRALLFLCVLIFTIGCSSTVSKKLVSTNRQPLPNGIRMIVWNEFDPEPIGLELIGNIKIGDSGFTTDCSYAVVLEHAKTAARNAGADVIKITEVIKPDIESSCYRLKAKIYSSGSEESSANLQTKINRLNQSRLPENTDYSVIYFYRPVNTESRFPVSTIEIKTKNDSLIASLKIGDRMEYHTKDFGIQHFYNDTDSSKNITINVQKGNEYFIRCGVTPDAMIGSPILQLIENRFGMKEYREMN